MQSQSAGIAPQSPAAARHPSAPQPTITLEACIEVAGIWRMLFTAGVGLLVGVLLAIQRLEAQALQNARLHISLQEVREQLEADLALGLELTSSGRAQLLLEDTLVHDPSLLAVEVITADGSSLFSTDLAAVGERAPEAWLTAMKQMPRATPSVGDAPAQVSWTGVVGNDITVGLPLRGPFGEAAGHVVATSQRLPPPSARNLVVVGTTIWLVFSLASVVLVWRALASIQARSHPAILRAAEQRLAQARQRINRALGSLAGLERLES